MSFSYKTLNSTDLTLTSYIANKLWEVKNSTLSENGITIYIGENLPLNRNNIFDPIDDIETSNEEYRRLKELGYDGDIFDKMFKSARYYFRKKSTEKKEPAKRRIYVGSQKDLLEAMDEHIKSNISSGDFKPSDGFDEFCKQNVGLLKEEIAVLCRAGLTDSNEIKAKIKKTYKNRYFLTINK
jgi:hypothetical protein